MLIHHFRRAHRGKHEIAKGKEARSQSPTSVAEKRGDVWIESTKILLIMHGRKRSEFKALQRDPKVAAGLAKKALLWHTVNKELSAQRGSASSDSSNQLELLDKLLSVNPDPLYLWNHRKELLTDDDNFNLQKELQVTQTALQNNPKAYGPWLHRKWAVGKGGKDDVLLRAELELTELFLNRDERNFHCWNYRRFIVGLLMGQADGSWPTTKIGPQVAARKITQEESASKDRINEILQGEWDFTTRKIQANFSNFSAFFQRSQLLAWKLSSQEQDAEQIITAELEIVVSAIFTEPDDQSAWWYHHFLLQQQSDLLEQDWFQQLLVGHMEELEELALEMPHCKWVFLGLYHAHTATRRDADKRCLVLERLIELDPDRSQRYRHLLAKEKSL